MKLSKFNNRIRLSENTDILFNSYTEESIIIDKRAELDSNTMDKKLLCQLKEKGFVVKITEDESEKICKEFEKAYNQSDKFKLTINPTLNCNFRCWYCYESHFKDAIMTKETINCVKALITTISESFSSLELAFFGGEPMMEFDSVVLPLIDFTHELFLKKGKDYEITFTTNGYLINDRIIDSLRKYHIGTSQITLDGGRVSHNRTRVSGKGDSFERIVNNIGKMTDAGFPVLIRVNVTKENVSTALEIPKYLEKLTKQRKSLMRVLVQQVWQDVNNDILDEIWEVYSEFNKIGILPWPRRFNFYKSICYADQKNTAVINYNGKIHKCTAIDFDRKKADGELENSGALHIETAFSKRLEKRANNTLCTNCRIYPVCNGGCSKNVDQAEDFNYCLHPSDLEKDKVVKNIIREQLHMAELNLSWR